MKTLISALCLVFALSGCFKKRSVENALVRGAQAPAAEATCAKILPPQEYKSLVSQLTPVDPLIVVSTNDLHGRVDEKKVELKVSDTESYSVTVGGLERLASYLAALCRHAKGRVLYLDAGDSYQGSALSNTTQGAAVVESFSALGLVASTFGNHEFDFGQEQIKRWLAASNRSFWYVTSSLQSTAGGQSIPWSQLNAPRFARSMVIDVAGVKVGIAGYTTESTAVKSLPDNVSSLSFQKLSRVLAEESEPLRQQGAQVTLLLSHAGGKCNMSLPASKGLEACGGTGSDELTQELSAKPSDAQKWSLVVAGHSHAAQRHLIAGVPVVQSTGLGQSLTHTQITVDNGKVSAQLFDPIYLCESHFENWSGCHPEEWSWRTDRPKTLGSLIPARVLGQTLNAAEGSRVRSALEPHRKKLQEQMSKVIAEFKTELPHNRLGKSPAAACLVDAWLADLRASNELWGSVPSAQLDVAFLNSGALRGGISAGKLTWGGLFELIPFDNTAHIVTLSTDELLRFAHAHEASPYDYLLASEGWVVKRSDNNTPSPRTTAVAPSATSRQANQKWNIALSTFSKTFLSRAGISAVPFDTGLSIRPSIARTLERGVENIPSCARAVEDRMEL